MKLSKEQVNFINYRKLSVAELEKQIDLFKQGTKFLDLVRPAKLIDGIRPLKARELEKFEKEYSTLIAGKRITKFVPASGAASRMFKDLYQFLETKKNTAFVLEFIDNLQKFAFYEKLEKILKQNNFDIEQLIAEKKYSIIIEFLLFKKGLSYGSLPKGLLYFHKDSLKVSTPINEHVREAIAYAGENANIAFSISKEFEDQFVSDIEKALEQTKNITYELSYQKLQTDTLAVTKDFNIIELNDNEILLRPGGHGALIENLNDINSDIIFIKNIDNVCSQKYLPETVKYKKALTAILLDIQEKVFDYSKKIEGYDGRNEAFNFELRSFFEQELGIFSMEFCRMKAHQKLEYFKTKLNRPIRVCGMVKNEGEPGGGPFWVKDKEGTISLQIVESSQINHNDENQKLIFSESSHFNPVDIVCLVKDRKGKKYDLDKFVEKDAVFISEKSYMGTEILALEHPGLWNGGMGKWNTIFVEVSSETFNPVKTVNDLLRRAHQN